VHKTFSYRLLQVGLTLGLGLSICSTLARAQAYTRTSPTPADMSCSGLITDQPVTKDSYVISGENSRLKSTFSDQDFIYINQGAEHGVKVGDKFDVMRPVTDDMAQTKWFKYQLMLTKAMGTRYADIGRLRVIHVDAKHPRRRSIWAATWCSGATSLHRPWRVRFPNFTWLSWISSLRPQEKRQAWS